MLLKRVITASILIPLVVLAILFLPSNIIAVIGGLLLVFAGFEWTGLMNLHSKAARAFVLAIICLVGYYFYVLSIPANISSLFALVFWVFAIVTIFFFPWGKKFWKNNLVSTIVGMFVLIPAWLSINFLHSDANFGPTWLLLLLSIVWGADIGAYFAGKKFGKNKLAPSLSPGKTWQGVFGAFVAVGIVVCLFHSFWLNNVNLTELLKVSLVTTWFSIIGDLVESMFKRIKGVKDSGTIFPGHGGMLDRIDSMLAALPIFTLGCYLII